MHRVWLQWITHLSINSRGWQPNHSLDLPPSQTCNENKIEQTPNHSMCALCADIVISQWNPQLHRITCMAHAYSSTFTNIRSTLWCTPRWNHLQLCIWLCFAVETTFWCPDPYRNQYLTHGAALNHFQFWDRVLAISF